MCIIHYFFFFFFTCHFTYHFAEYYHDWRYENAMQPYIINYDKYILYKCKYIEL